MITDVMWRCADVLTVINLLDCSSSMFGCCPDLLTPASGWNLIGCPGRHTQWHFYYWHAYVYKRILDDCE